MEVIAHRGDRKNYPDNTLEGFESAIKKGLNSIELDVYYNEQYGIYIVHHMNHDNIETLPKLEDLFIKCENKVKYFIEIKDFNQKIISEIIKLVDKFNIKDFQITSSILPMLLKVRVEYDNVETGMIFKAGRYFEDWMNEADKFSLLIGYSKLCAVNSIHIGSELDFYTKDIVDKIHMLGYKVFAHMNDCNQSTLDCIFSRNIDGFTADDIEIVKFVN